MFEPIIRNRSDHPPRRHRTVRQSAETDRLPVEQSFRRAGPENLVRLHRHSHYSVRFPPAARGQNKSNSRPSRLQTGGSCRPRSRSAKGRRRRRPGTPERRSRTARTRRTGTPATVHPGIRSRCVHSANGVAISGVLAVVEPSIAIAQISLGNPVGGRPREARSCRRVKNRMASLNPACRLVNWLQAPGSVRGLPVDLPRAHPGPLKSDPPAVR